MATLESEIRAILMCRLDAFEARGTDHWEFRKGEVVRKDSYGKIVEQ
jgi:hypothetical protein